MKILTINTWNTQGPWKKRSALLIKEVEALAPDILALQEAVDGEWIEALGREAGLPYIFFPDNQSGLAILSAHALLKTEEVVLKAQAKYEEFKRSICYAQLSVSGLVVHVFNVHLSWRPPDFEVRSAQIKELLDYAAKCIGPGQVGVFVGDFNGHDDEVGIKLMGQTSGVIDLYRAKNEDSPGYTWSDQNPYTHEVKLPNRRLDYIFMLGNQKNISVKQSKIVLTQGDSQGVFPTDHFGLFGECEVQNV